MSLTEFFSFLWVTTYDVIDRVFLVWGLTLHGILLLFKTANLSHSNSADSQFLNESNTILPACVMYNAVTGSAPCYLSELLHLY